MAVVQISRIQNRRGLEADLPNLASAELGWSVDSRRLYIGNGTTEEGAPQLGKTEVLTQYSIIDFTTGFASNIVTLQGNILTLTSNVGALSNRISVLEGGVSDVKVTLPATTSGLITNINANNAVITYTLTQGSNQRTGLIKLANNRAGSVAYSEEYDETSATDVTFTLSANTGNTQQANLQYTTTTTTQLSYNLNSLA